LIRLDGTEDCRGGRLDRRAAAWRVNPVPDRHQPVRPLAPQRGSGRSGSACLGCQIRAERPRHVAAATAPGTATLLLSTAAGPWRHCAPRPRRWMGACRVPTSSCGPGAWLATSAP